MEKPMAESIRDTGSGATFATFITSMEKLWEQRRPLDMLSFLRAIPLSEDTREALREERGMIAERKRALDLATKIAEHEPRHTARAVLHQRLEGSLKERAEKVRYWVESPTLCAQMVETLGRVAP